jgi:hypothetical protein
MNNNNKINSILRFLGATSLSFPSDYRYLLKRVTFIRLLYLGVLVSFLLLGSEIGVFEGLSQVTTYLVLRISKGIFYGGVSILVTPPEDIMYYLFGYPILFIQLSYIIFIPLRILLYLGYYLGYYLFEAIFFLRLMLDSYKALDPQNEEFINNVNFAALFISSQFIWVNPMLYLFILLFLSYNSLLNPIHQYKLRTSFWYYLEHKHPDLFNLFHSDTYLDRVSALRKLFELIFPGDISKADPICVEKLFSRILRENSSGLTYGFDAHPLTMNFLGPNSFIIVQNPEEILKDFKTWLIEKWVPVMTSVLCMILTQIIVEVNLYQKYRDGIFYDFLRSRVNFVIGCMQYYLSGLFKSRGAIYSHSSILGGSRITTGIIIGKRTFSTISRQFKEINGGNDKSIQEYSREECIQEYSGEEERIQKMTDDLSISVQNIIQPYIGFKDISSLEVQDFQNLL